MKLEGGYIRLYRRLYDNPVFADLVEASAFVWMVASAAWREHVVRYKRRRITLERGQLALSNRDLAVKFGWSEAKARRYLNRLISDAMICASSDAGVNIITLCNYSEYQNIAQDSDALKDAPEDPKPTQKRRRSDAQTEINKKNKKNKKNKIKPSLSLFDEFWESFGDKRGKQAALKSWEKLNPEEQLGRKIIEGAKQYHRWSKENPGTMRKMAQGWLNDRRWEDELPTSTTAPQKIKIETPEEWRTFLGDKNSRFRPDFLQNSWPAAQLGTSPWKGVNDRIPEEVYEEYRKIWRWK